MKVAFLDSTNVTKVAQSLLDLEMQNLQEQYHLDAESFVYQLKKALSAYTNPPEDEQEIKQWNTIDNIERSLKYLMHSVNSFMSLLTPEAKKQLEKQFHSSQSGVYHYG